MRTRKAPLFVLPVLGFAFALMFQNCDGGFQYDPLSGQLTSLSTGTLDIQAFSASGMLLSDTASLSPNTSYQLRATGANLESAVLLWSLGATNSAGCALTSSGDQLRRDLKCTMGGSVEVKLEAVLADRTSAVATITRSVSSATGTGGGGTNPTPTPPPMATPPASIPAADLVEFRIRAGTGTGAWNDANAPVIAFVGQTIRIYNDDSSAHRLHTSGKPCASMTSDIAPNASGDCQVTAAHDANATDAYDGAAGASAIFYVYTLDGAAIYSDPAKAGCNNCHGPITNSTRKGATFNQIKNALQNVGAMRSIKLTDDEIRAIAYRLSK